MMFRIYYADGSVVEGSNAGNWKKAPNNGVQAVVRFPTEHGLRWHDSSFRPVRDRDLWTGEDSYDPFGFGAKQGSLIDYVAYQAIWDRACGDP